MSEIKLIFPPFSESAFHGPHLAIPILRGVLASHGIKSSAVDLNIKTIRKIVLRKNLKLFLSHIKNSILDDEMKMRASSCITLLIDGSIDNFLNSGSTPLKQLLKIVRNVLFPTPIDIAQCLTMQFSRPQLANDLYEEFVAEILAGHPKIICFSIAFSEQLAETVELARKIKKHSSNCQIWIGGSQINLLEESQLLLLEACPLFDRISIGNGEQTINRIFESYDKKELLPSKIIRSGSMTSIEINNLPRPIFDTSMIDYIKPISLPVLVTKGCYWGKCTFCDYPRLSDLGGKRYIARSPSLVLADIEFFRINYPNTFSQINLISDAIPPSWYTELAMLAISKNIKLNTWSYMMHHKNLDEDFFQLLSNAGVKSINFGTESLIDRILIKMKKQASSEDIFKNILSAKKSGISIVCNVIPDYPTITRDEAFENARKFQSLSCNIDSLNPQMFDLTAGTAIAAEPKMFGIEVQKSAYHKTNHGYHSLVYKREDGITDTDKKILKEIFTRIKWNILITKRINNIKLKNSEHEEFIFDGSIALLPNNTIWIMSIGSQWHISKLEFNLIEKIIKCHAGHISLLKLRNLAFNEGMEIDFFNNWINHIIESGLIINSNKLMK